MINEQRALEQIASGLSAVCAWCEKWWVARERYGRMAGSCDQHQCGGPASGRAFPQYKGPRPNLASYCFICGKDADMGVEFSGSGVVGCCSEHESLLRMIIQRKQNVVVREQVVPVVRSKDPE